MAVIDWSTLADGQTVVFDPAADRLHFDDGGIAAASVALDLASNAQTVLAAAGKSVTLQAAPKTLAPTNVTFADGSVLLIGDAVAGAAPNESGFTLDGGAGADLLIGGVQPFAIARVNTAADGAQGTHSDQVVSLSSDGRYAVFESASANLVAGDTNSATDVFVKHVQSGAIARASTAQDGAQANGASTLGTSGAVSADGRYVVFSSGADNLVAADTNAAFDVFVKDLQTGAIQRVSTSAAGAQADGASQRASITPDGRHVAFVSSATNLVAGDTNAAADVFVKDLQTGAVVRASVSASGAQGDSSFGTNDDPAISADGRYVAFVSFSGNLVPGDTNDIVFGGSYVSSGGDVFVKDLHTSSIVRANTTAAGGQESRALDVFEPAYLQFRPGLSADGRYAVFHSAGVNLVSGDTNGGTDVFVKDLQTGTVQRASTAADGAQTAFRSQSLNASLSGDGRHVAFTSNAPDLVAGDTNGKYDAFVKDMLTGAVIHVSTSADAAQADSDSAARWIAANGQTVAFSSAATNLVTGDTNAMTDLFVATVIRPDVLRGGAGDDVYVVARAAVSVVEQAGEGTDTVHSGSSHVLGDHVERLILTGSAAVDGTGNAADNTITGNGANNVIDGAAGADTLIGGGGDDTFLVDHGGDVVIEAGGIVGGQDAVRALIDFTLAADVEHLALIGAGAINGTGNAADNELTGNVGPNMLLGLAGADTLRGEAGDDWLEGGDGDDQLFGNDGADTLIGEADDDVLRGGGGGDVLIGDRGETSSIGGQDELRGESGNDILDGGAGADLIYGGDWGDIIDGDAGSDYVFGGTGPDIMQGSAASAYRGATTGGDLFVYSQMDDAGDSLFGFDVSPAPGENDGIDLRSLFDALGYAGATPRADGFLQLQVSGADTLVRIDANGAAGGASFVTLATLVAVDLTNPLAIPDPDLYFLFQ